MRLIRLVLCVIGMTATAAVSAFAGELTLDDCISLALKNRESIIRARSAEELAKAGQRAALGAFLPNISASYGWDYSKTDGESFESRSAGLHGSMSVLDFSNFFNYAAARADRAAARLDVIASEQDLIYAVKTSYYAYLAVVQNASVAEEAVKRSQEQLKLIQSKFELGSASKSDVLKQKVQYGSDQLALLKAKNGVTTAAADLAYTVGVDPQQNWQFSDKYTVRTFDGTLDSAIAFGLTHQPSLLSIQQNLSSARSSYKSAMSSYLPSVSATASYTHPFEAGREDVSTKRYGLGVSWNIFDGFSRERSVTSAKVTRNNLQASLADARNLAVSDIKTAYLEIDRLKEQKSVADENVAAATEDLKITQEKYNLGAATILDLLNAQVSLKQAEVDRISADFDLNLAVSKLEKSMGKL
jgi:outer membrane protein